MNRLVLAIAMMMCGPVWAEPVKPIAGGVLDGIPLARAMSTLDVLTDTPLIAGGQARLFTVMSREGGECGVGDQDDADTCPRYTLYLALNGETSQPVDFALFRLPETLRWKLPKGSDPKSESQRVTFQLLACEMKTTKKGRGWKGTYYALQIDDDIKIAGDGFGHYVFNVDLRKLPGEWPDCYK